MLSDTPDTTRISIPQIPKPVPIVISTAENGLAETETPWLRIRLPEECGNFSIHYLVETADDKKLQTWASEIAHIGTHNAYHVGQMIIVRKLQGSWNPEKGVK